MIPKFKLGEIVSLVNTDKTGVICEDPKNINGEIHYVVFIDNVRKTYSQESIESFKEETVDAIKALKEKNFAFLQDFKSYLTYIKVERPLSNNLYSFLSSRTEFQVHQFRPLLKYLDSPYQRLLIADEVGVGKTIEAGIIYTELLSRKELRNVLVICPPSLRFKWKNELKKRFSEDLDILDSKQIKLLLKEYDKYPNGASLKGIASFQAFNNEKIREELEKLQIPWDLVIIDEAHYMRNSGNKRNKLGKLLSSTAEGMLLLSATPLQLGKKDLFNLINIMLPKEFDNFNTFEEQVKPNEHLNTSLRKISKKESTQSIYSTLACVTLTNQRKRFESNPNYNFCIELLKSKSVLETEDVVNLQRKISELNVLSHIYTRTKKNEISTDFPLREPYTITVEYNNAERQFYNNVSNLFLSMNPSCPTGFLLQMPLRQVASCIPATVEYLEDIVERRAIKLDDEDSNDDKSSKNKHKLTQEHISKIEEIIDFAKNNLGDQDSKTNEFIKTITEVLGNGEIKKVIIFSFFKRTLKHLERLLKERGFSIAKIDGDVPFEVREDIMQNFSKPEGYQILLLSEVGGEGLDMQFCNCIFNYDLPWNPMKIEQRIGRLDRYGQRNPKIHIYNFSIKDTIESNIFLRLYNRIKLFEQYIGELEPILGPEIKELTKELFNPRLTQRQQEELADKIACAIEKKKKDLKEFDEARSKLIGQDNYFTEQITDIQKNEKFITPSEIMNLISSFIDEKYPKSKLIPSSKENEIWRLKLDSGFQNFIKEHLKKSRDGDPTERFMHLISQESFEITFDYKTANYDSSIEFITIRHPLVKSIIEFYKQESSLRNTCCITWQDDSLEDENNENNYLFFIYLLDISSFKKSLTFVPVVVDINSNKVNEKYSEKLFYILKNSSDLLEFPEINSECIDACERASESHVILLKKRKENDLEEENKYLVTNLLNSLQQTCDFSIKKIDEKIKELTSHPSEGLEKIIRMKESQKINLIRNFNNKKTELEAKKRVIVSHELISLGYLNVRR